MKNFFLVIAFLSFYVTQAQMLPCGTTITPKQRAILKDFRPELDVAKLRQAESEVRSVAISAHIIHRSDGSGGLTQQQLEEAIANLNEYYADAYLFFFLVKVNHINNSDYFNFVTTDEATLGNLYDIRNTVNIYFANSVSDGQGGLLCGYAYFPEGPDRILMDNICAINGTTLPHEVGHFFTLYHTHGPSNSTLTTELVNGSNCVSAGDELCDTPADPQLSNSNVTTSCIYTGSVTDANGDRFAPDPTNLMSYSRKECRANFSPGQYARMDAAYEAFRSYLISRSLVADFYMAAAEVCTGTIIDFEDRSLNAISWSWTFEGGTPATSTLQHPSVRYDNQGSFDARLIISDESGTKDTLLLEDHVVVTHGPESELLTDATGFESTSLEKKVINPDNGITFSQKSGVSKKGTKSALLNFYEYGDIGEEDYLVLSFLANDFSNKYLLSFDYAYAVYDATFFDGLDIVYRAGCELDWQVLWSKQGTGLATTTAKTAAFVPTASHWKHIDLELTIPDSVALFELAFRGINGYGNNLYLDEIRLTTTFDVLPVKGFCEGEPGQLAVSIPNSASFTFSINGANYQEDSVFRDLDPGLYTLYVKDPGGRVITRSSQLEAPQPVSLSLNKEDVSCYGAADGAALMQASGGGGMFTYVLNADTLNGNTFSGLLAGSFSAIAFDQNGCSDTVLFEINEPDQLTATMDLINPACFGETGSLQVSAFGGTGPLEYSLGGAFQVENAFDSVPAGSYDLTVRDTNLCETTLQFDIIQPDSLYLEVVVEDEVCENDGSGSIMLLAHGGAGEHSYFIDEEPATSVTDQLLNGIYTVKVTDGNGCAFQGEVTVGSRYGYPEAPVIVHEDGRLHIAETDLEIRWYVNGELLPEENGASINVGPGIYQASLANEGGFCASFSEELLILTTADETGDQLILYPNPAYGHVSVRLPDGLANRITAITVLDLSGKEVLTTRELVIPISWPSGTYIIQVSGEDFRFRKRLIVR